MTKHSPVTDLIQGVSVFPDFLHPNATDYWAGEFKEFFDPSSGIDIDGVWYAALKP